MCQALCSQSSLQGRLLHSAQSTPRPFFLALGAGLVWVQMPTPPILGCVTLGSSPNLSEPHQQWVFRRVPGGLWMEGRF